VPAMAADVPPTDRNLGRFAERRTGVVSQPAPHAARHAYRHGAELAVEVLGIVPLMPPRQLTDEVAVLGARAQPVRRHCRRPDWMRDDRSPRGASLSASAPLDEDNDRAQHGGWR